jgi:hypothetical protein
VELLIIHIFESYAAVAQDDAENSRATGSYHNLIDKMRYCALALFFGHSHSSDIDPILTLGRIREPGHQRQKFVGGHSNTAF